MNMWETRADDAAVNERAAAAVEFARSMTAPGAAVIIDTETVSMGGAICEISVIDAASGVVLIDTLVNPGVPIEAEASAIHGITDGDVAAEGVPTWPQVYPDLLRATRDRVALAYNADYDRSVIAADCARYGLACERLGAADQWADVMVQRSAHARTDRWLPNGGGHRALGDVRRTRAHLLAMTVPMPQAS